MKLVLKKRISSPMEFTLGNFSQRFEPGVPVEVKDEAFARYLASQDSVKVADDGAADEEPADGNTKSEETTVDKEAPQTVETAAVESSETPPLVTDSSVADIPVSKGARNTKKAISTEEQL